jgi:hypothetical protein
MLNFFTEISPVCVVDKSNCDQPNIYIRPQLDFVPTSSDNTFFLDKKKPQLMLWSWFFGGLT